MTTALIEAAQRGHLEIVKLLLEFGADPRLKSQIEGWNAFEAASQNGHHETASILGKAVGIDYNPSQSERSWFTKLMNELFGDNNEP